jgi:hypothetical protein
VLTPNGGVGTAKSCQYLCSVLPLTLGRSQPIKFDDLVKHDHYHFIMLDRVRVIDANKNTPFRRDTRRPRYRHGIALRGATRFIIPREFERNRADPTEKKITMCHCSLVSSSRRITALVEKLTTARRNVAGRVTSTWDREDVAHNILLPPSVEPRRWSQ